jgi:serine/threonine protein phosphatase PrpC
MRKRLTMAMDGNGATELDGVASANAGALNDQNATGKGGGGIVTKVAVKSKVGFVPMNPGKVNQDSFFHQVGFDSDPSQYYFGVMDGHGVNGHDVSGLMKRRLAPALSKEASLKTDPKEALRASFLRVNQEVCKSGTDVAFSGSTCVTVFMRGTTVYCGNAGDSRAVLASYNKGQWKAIPLSDDHKPDRPDEKKRILEHDGRVEAFRGMDGKPVGPARVWLKRGDAPGLAMARSFGDTVAASVGCIAEPEVMVRKCEPSDKALIMGSDGVWEFIPSDEACRIAGPHLERGDAAKAVDELMDVATKRWRQSEEVVDDITCLVALLNVP